MEPKDLITAAVGIALGVLIEDPLTRVRDNLLHKYKKLFYKPPHIPSENFYMGTIKTDWRILDGNGEEEYAPDTITTRFENKNLLLSEEAKKEKAVIETEQKQNHKNGKSFAWNGEIFTIDKFIVTRSGGEEKLALDLWFHEADYYSFLATNRTLQKLGIPKDHDWKNPIKGFCNSLGLDLCVVTEDDYLILSKRSGTVGTYKNLYHISVNEGLSRTLDRGVKSQAPDVYRCAIRGIAEELGVPDVNVDDISLLSFGVDTKRAQWGLLGIAKIKRKAEEILEWRKQGAKDKWETGEIHLIKFRLVEIMQFINEHREWTPAGLPTLYHTLVHEFSRKKVHDAIEKYIS